METVTITREHRRFERRCQLTSPVRAWKVIDDISTQQRSNLYIDVASSSLSTHGGDACWTPATGTGGGGSRVTRVIRIAFALLLAWTTYEVTVTGASLKKETLKIAGAVIAVSAALQFLIVVGDWLSFDEEPVKRVVEKILSNRLSAFYDSDTLTGNPATISMHVFEVPILFRRIFHFKLRSRLRRVFPQWMQKMAWRPGLVRVGEGGMRRLPPSGIVFRKCYGLGVIALQDNEYDNIYWVNFDDGELISALGKGPKTWKDESAELTQNLRYQAAKRLANRYSEALALVIQDSTSGEALGCLTIEAAARADSDLRGNAALHSELRSAADLLEPVLARRRA